VPGEIPLSDLRVVVGRTVLTSTQGQKRRVAAISIHPRWDPVTFSFDAAVVHLASPINGIRPIMLVTPGGPTSTPARATAAARCSSRPPAGASSRPASPAGASAAAPPASPVYTRLSNRGVGTFILPVTGGVPVNSIQAA
jgi:hypothetical protein